VDIVADGADGGDVESGRVGDVPVEVALAGVDGAGVAAAHGDDDVGGLDLVAGQWLGVLAGQVEPDLGHGGDDGGVELAGGLGSGRGDPDAAVGLVVSYASGGASGSGMEGPGHPVTIDLGKAEQARVTWSRSFVQRGRSTLTP